MTPALGQPGESVIARSPVRDLSIIDNPRPELIVPREGYGLLTTHRVVLTTHAGGVVYEIERAKITNLTQRHAVIKLGGLDGSTVQFALVCPLAGPVPWDWYLKPAGSLGWSCETTTVIGPMTDEGRRAVGELRLSVGRDTRPLTTIYFDDLPADAFRWEDIAEIVYYSSYSITFLVCRLVDGRWLYVQHVVERTGDIFTTYVIARSLDSLWWGALSEDERDVVTAQMTRDRVDEELVRLDAILELGDRNVSAHAVRRIESVKRSRGL